MNKACSLLCLVSLAVSQAPLLIAENFESIVAPVVPYKRYGNGTLVELRDGRILLAYNEWTELGEMGDSSPANVSARISDDRGRTWGRPSVLHEITSRESFGRVGPPSLLRLRNGETGFVYGQLDSYSDYPYYFKRSSDEGRTWSQAVRITGDPAYYILNNHRVIQPELCTAGYTSGGLSRKGPLGDPRKHGVNKVGRQKFSFTNQPQGGHPNGYQRKQHSSPRPVKQGPAATVSQPNKIGASTPYNFCGRKPTPYGGLLPVVERVLI